MVAAVVVGCGRGYAAGRSGTGNATGVVMGRGRWGFVGRAVRFGSRPRVSGGGVFFYLKVSLALFD